MGTVRSNLTHGNVVSTPMPVPAFLAEEPPRHLQIR